jgi:hypothetical protein
LAGDKEDYERAASSGDGAESTNRPKRREVDSFADGGLVGIHRITVGTKSTPVVDHSSTLDLVQPYLTGLSTLFATNN